MPREPRDLRPRAWFGPPPRVRPTALRRGIACADADRRRAKEEERGSARRAAGVASRNETTPERSQVAPLPSKARRGTHSRFRICSFGQPAAMSFIEASLSSRQNL